MALTKYIGPSCDDEFDDWLRCINETDDCGACDRVWNGELDHVVGRWADGLAGGPPRLAALGPALDEVGDHAAPGAANRCGLSAAPSRSTLGARRAG